MKFIFDLGNVMVYYRPMEYVKKLGYTGEKADALKKAIFDSQAWLDCDAGTLTREQEIEAICAASPDMADDIRSIMSNCDTMLTPIPESVRALERLTRDGFECYYLSNTNAPAMEFIGSFDYFKLFKGGIASYAEKLSKPEPAIYECLLERYGLKREECVFFDDNMVNVVAARAVGMNSLQLEDADGLYRLTDALIKARLDYQPEKKDVV